MRKAIMTSLLAIGLASCGSNGGSEPAIDSVFGGGSGGANSAPAITMVNSDQSAPIGHNFQYDATQNGQTFTDAQGDTMTYAVTFSPDDGDFTAAAGIITGQASSSGDVTVTITASDATSTSNVESFVIARDFDQDAIQAAFGASIDLAALAAYESPSVPAYIQAPNVVNSPVTNAGATLGRVLFYDPALSIDDTVSCSSCHQQQNAFGDARVVSNGVDGGVTGRHSMRLINTIYSDEEAFFWDERAVDLEDQVTDPIRDHNEHGFSGQNGRPTFDDLLTKLSAIDYYDELFSFTFGDGDITEARMQSALSQFVNSIVSFDSRFDEGRAITADVFLPFDNYTFDENRGKNLYMSGPEDNGAGCRRCHADPEYSVFQDSGHIGTIGVAGDANATDLTNVRSPSLRDVFKPDGSENGPFMHDGSLATMRAVIDHYDAIPVPTTEPLRTDFMNTIDQQLVEFGAVEQLNLTDVEKDQIIAFLQTLSGQAVYTDPKWSSPF